MTVMMGSVRSVETPVTLYQSARRHIPEDLNFCQHHSENLKSCIIKSNLPILRNSSACGLCL
jgi:hypothetical protein